MSKRSHLTRAASALREHALAYPETHEDFPWGHSAIKVKGKAFLFMAVGINKDNLFSLSVKLPRSANQALNLPFASPTEYGLGKSGWVTARFKANDEVPVEMLKEWIDESFRAIAPKRVLAKLSDARKAAPTAPAAIDKRKKRRVGGVTRRRPAGKSER